MREQVKAIIVLGMFCCAAILAIGLALDWFGPGARKVRITREYMVVREDGLVRFQTTISASAKNAFMVGEPVQLSVSTLVVRTDTKVVNNDHVTAVLDWEISQSYNESKDAEIKWRKWEFKQPGERGSELFTLPRLERIDPIQLLMTEKQLENSVYFSDLAMKGRHQLSEDQRRATPFQSTTLVYDTSGPKALGIEILGDGGPIFDQTLGPLFEVESSSVAVQILMAKIGLVLAVFFGLLAAVPLVENFETTVLPIARVFKRLSQRHRVKTPLPNSDR